MARYLIQREREFDVTRYERAEAEIEVADDATEQEIKHAAERLRDDRWHETDEWNERDSFTDSYAVVKRLDVDEVEVRGKPEDFGVIQEALIA